MFKQARPVQNVMNSVFKQIRVCLNIVFVGFVDVYTFCLFIRDVFKQNVHGFYEHVV